MQRLEVPPEQGQRMSATRQHQRDVAPETGTGAAHDGQSARRVHHPSESCANRSRVDPMADFSCATMRASVGTWRSLVAYLNGVQGVPGSNPGVPTTFPRTTRLTGRKDFGAMGR